MDDPPTTPDRGVLVFFLLLTTFFVGLWYFGYGNVFEMVTPFGGR
jgi:hypothetical protein